ncbi:hypothetical protein C1645_751818 [Glomus cerebriforme]|uniref:Uncharacterized protein n=1 Tax=Glomus cerebriforme TaxID=658196 RepID=A0A397TS51_9GLOM|nr:hypothetical protein C1645_751818 [Glomus cerebriforme]
MVKKLLKIFSLTFACTLLGVVSRLDSVEAACDPTVCLPPKCFCPSINPPGGLTLDKTPQFVQITFDDSIQPNTLKVANELIGKRVNPNGCPIKGTYYVSIQYTDFSLVTQWYAAGNEVADHTMTHPQDPFDDEIIGNKQSLNAFAGIPNGKIAGWRSPFLNWQPKTFDIIAQQGFLYDSSTTALEDDATWPYTMDYGLYNDCWKGFCNQTIHPGLFEIPMAAILDDQGSPHLMDPYLDGPTDTVKGWLQNNFLRHAKQGKTPFGIYVHPAHLYQIPGTPLAPNTPDPDASLKMLEEFLDWALAQPDTWVVTSQQLLEWMKNPVPADQLKTYAPFSCQVPKIGKEICNGLDDNGNGQIDEGLLESCNFNTVVWSTCYGCPSENPSLANPVPKGGDRFHVPTTCDTVWWDPIANQCLCQDANCAYTDLSKPAGLVGNSSDPNNSNGNNNNGNGNNKSGKQNGASSITGLNTLTLIPSFIIISTFMQWIL